MIWRTCGRGRGCRQTHPYINVRSKVRQVRFNALDGLCHQRRNGRDREGISDHSVWAWVAARLCVTFGMPIGTMHRMVDLSLCERLEPFSLRFSQSLGTDADDKLTIAGLRRHPTCRNDIRKDQRNR